jgi:hypothetical protein
MPQGEADNCSILEDESGAIWYCYELEVDEAELASVG